MLNGLRVQTANIAKKLGQYTTRAKENDAPSHKKGGTPQCRPSS